jgi:ABC-type multidrug transport system permease subunit
MKFLNVIKKSLIEQIRSFWFLLLTLSMGPFFILIYFLIIESQKVEYKVLVVNNDKSFYSGVDSVYHGHYLLLDLFEIEKDSATIPFICEEIASKDIGLELLKNKKADALIVIPSSFSSAIEKQLHGDTNVLSAVEFVGDLTNPDYLISAIWVNEALNNYMFRCAGTKRLIQVNETALGISGNIGLFDSIVPGILILSLIMLMFTASIAFVSEVENKTIMRLKLSMLSSFEFFSGVSFVQLLVGILSVILTLITAIMLGFQYSGSILIMFLVASLTSLSIIAFSLIIAAVTKSANEVLVVGNFPMFFFMFFTGAAFPLKSEPWFTIAGYPITLQGLMTPTHAINALNKTLVMSMDFKSIIPEMLAIIFLSIIYFIIGAFLFKRKHMRLN